MGFEIWMVANQELEEEGGDADDGEHQKVRDEEGAASVLKNETLDNNKFNGGVVIVYKSQHW